MLITVILFWVSFAVLFYCYIGYGMLLYSINRIRRVFVRRTKETETTEWPSVTMIIPAYNEGMVLEQKIKNTLDTDYPPDKLKVIFITDGSTDGSERIIQKYPSITLLHQPDRQGKMAAINRAMQAVATPVVVFSDANAVLNRECIRRIVGHYTDPKTGGVAGEKKILLPKYKSAIGEAEGIYWNYESFMKKQDAEFNTVVGAAGELYSILTRLFPIVSNNIILDDFVISMKVCLQGYKIKYEPGSFATELPSSSLKEEKKRKVRISAGAYQSLGYLKSALNVFKYPLLTVQYGSRRLLRWVLCPFMLIVFLLTNLSMVIAGNLHAAYTLFLIAQLWLYTTALTGGLLISAGKRVALFTIPFYFVFMNYCLVRGLLKFLSGTQSVLWEKSLRQTDE